MRIHFLLIALTLTACSTRHNDPGNRPGNETPTAIESAELNDPATRISGHLMTLRYDDGGIIFSRGDDGSISGVRLSDDNRFLFDPNAPTLSVNGANIPISSAALIKEKDSCRWYRIITSDGDEPVYIVIDDL